MAKNLTGGAVINYGPSLPTASLALDGTLFYKTDDVAQSKGLYIFNFIQDLTPGTPGDQVGQGWSSVASSSAGLFVSLAGDVMTGSLEVPENLRLTSAATEQRLVFGSQTGFGVNRPYILQGSSADRTIRLGFGNNWAAEDGGTLTNILTIDTSGTSTMTIGGFTVWHSGNDGAGSGLDADLLDGSSSAFFLDLANATGTLASARLSGTYGINISGNAATATSATTANTANSATTANQWTTARTISLSGDVTGSASISGAGNVNIVTTAVGGGGDFVARTGDSMSGALAVNIATNATSPTTGALRTTGGIGAALNIYAGGTIYANGDVISSAASDVRLKKNVLPIVGALDKLKMINGYTYDWNVEACTDAGYTPIRVSEHGVIAQEIEQVMVDAVVPTGFNADFKTVKYERLVALLIAAVKEQQVLIENLTQQVNAK